MSKNKKAGRIIAIAATALNAALWLGASVYFGLPFITEVESAEGPAAFVYLIFLVFCVMGFVNAVLLLPGVILYHKSHRKSAMICALLLYICPLLMASVVFGLVKAAFLISVSSILWIIGINTCIVLLIIGYVKSRRKTGAEN